MPFVVLEFKISEIPSFIANSISSRLIPSITISNTQLVSLSSLDLEINPFKLGQYSKFVEAIKFLYFEPTFDPDLTIPPGKGKMTFYTSFIFLTARSTAPRTLSISFPRTRIFPPPIPFI